LLLSPLAAAQAQWQCPAVQAQWQPSMAPTAWSFRFSPGMPSSPSVTAGGWFFWFPNYAGKLPCSGSCPSVHYLTTAARGAISGKSITISGRVDVGPTTQFNYQTNPDNTCTTPATAHLLIERKGDDLTQDYYRWWSSPLKVPLQAGQFSVTLPLTPDQWSSVLGETGNSSAAAAQGFIQALANAGEIGMTFGGGCFFGHGVSASGVTVDRDSSPNRLSVHAQLATPGPGCRRSAAPTISQYPRRDRHEPRAAARPGTRPPFSARSLMQR
jgi:hypothetical protein